MVESVRTRVVMLHDDDVVDVNVEVKVEVNNLQCLRQNMDQICQRLLLFGLIVLYVYV